MHSLQLEDGMFNCPRFNVREGLLYESTFLDYAMAIQKEKLNIVIVFL
jgi:hypothetical protein